MALNLRALSLPDLSKEKRRNTTLSLSEGFAGAARGDVLASSSLSFCPRPKPRSALKLADKDKLAPELDRILPIYYRTRQMVIHTEKAGFRATRQITQELAAQEASVGREIRPLFPMIFQRFDEMQIARVLRAMDFMKLSSGRWIFGDETIADAWPGDNGDLAFLLLYGRVSLYMDTMGAGDKLEVFRGAVFSKSRRFQIGDEFIQPEEYVVEAAQCEEPCIVCILSSKVLETCFADRAFGNKRIAQGVRTVPQLSRVVKSEFEMQKKQGDTDKKNRMSAKEEDAESNALLFALRDLSKVATAIHVMPGQEVICEEPMEEILLMVVKGCLEVRGDVELVQKLEALPPKKLRVRVRIHRGEDLKQDSVWDTLDPYVVVKLGGEKEFRTPVEDNAGINPTWNFEGVLLYHNEPTVDFFVMERETYNADKPNGHGSVNVTKIAHDGRWDGVVPLSKPKQSIFRSEETTEEEAGRLHVSIWWDTEPISEFNRTPMRRKFQNQELFRIGQQELWGHEQIMLQHNFRRTLELAAREMAYKCHLEEFRVVGAQSKSASEPITCWKVTKHRFLDFVKHLGRQKQLTQATRVHALEKQYHLKDILTRLVETWEQEELALFVRSNMMERTPREEAMDPQLFRKTYRGCRAYIMIRNGLGINNGSFFAKLDPYVSIKFKVGIGDVKKKKQVLTRVLKDSGPDPVWDDHGSIVYQGETALEISVYDYEPNGVDDLVAVGTLQLEQVVAGFEGMVKLSRPGKKKKPLKPMFLTVGVSWEHPPMDPNSTTGSMKTGNTTRMAITGGG